MERRRTGGDGGREEDAGDAGLMESRGGRQEGRERLKAGGGPCAELTSAVGIQRRRRRRRAPRLLRNDCACVRN